MLCTLNTERIIWMPANLNKDCLLIHADMPIIPSLTNVAIEDLQAKVSTEKARMTIGSKNVPFIYGNFAGTEEFGDVVFYSKPEINSNPV